MDYIRGMMADFSLSEINVPTVGIIDILDIFIVAYLIYKIIFWIKETRAWTLFKGILVIFGFMAVAVLLRLNTILWILSNTISVGIIALVVVFQPELRKALEQLGKGRLFTSIIKLDAQETGDKSLLRTVDEVAKAADKLSGTKTGALILIEREVPLGDLERTGISIDGVVSSQLLVNIFEYNTPLHDGAVIIRNNRVAAATCFLPLTDSREISMELGTRHRAAIGASEISDADIIIVSEETGAISLAREGVLYRNLSMDTLKNLLLKSMKTPKKKIPFWKGGGFSE